MVNKVYIMSDGEFLSDYYFEDLDNALSDYSSDGEMVHEYVLSRSGKVKTNTTVVWDKAETKKKQ